MEYIGEAFGEAVRLIVGLDRELLHAVGVSLKVSLSATALAAILGVPAGAAVASRRFRGRRAVAVALNTSMSVPTVVIGLLVFAAISRSGPLGGLGLMFTPAAMIIGQTLLALPVVASFTFAALDGADPRIALTARTLGASEAAAAWAVVSDSRAAMIAAVAAAFGRVFAEIGISMMLGGNISMYTRNITTTIALQSGLGDFAMGLALGMILLAIAFAVNAAVQALRTRES